MESRTLYVSDLDGTLLGPDSLISERSAAIISRLSRRGALFAVATARTPATVVPLLRHTFTTVPAIVMTGAATWSLERNCFETVHLLSPDDLHAATGILARHGISPFIYALSETGRSDGRVLDVFHSADNLTRMEQNFVDERLDCRLKHFYLASRLPDASRGRTMLIFGMAGIDAVRAAADELRLHTGCSVSSYPDIFNPETGLIEVYTAGVSKAAAVSELAARYRADRTVVFGDSLNDLPMFRTADLAVAVENALPEVREAADIVTGPNTSDSVARFIESDFVDKH